MRIQRGPLNFFRATFLWNNALDETNGKLDWCRENLTGHYTLDLGMIHLFNEADALAYKLKWEE